MNNPDLIIPIITLIVSAVVSISGSVLTYRVQERRAKAQNKSDDINTAKIALQISESSAKRQLELENEVIELQHLLNTFKYRAEIHFTIGNPAKIDFVELTPLDVNKS